jgi:hypothetical protein
MERRICAIVILFACGPGSWNGLLGCGDKFVGAMRGTRLQQAPRGRQETVLIYSNSSSDVPVALARVAIDGTLRAAGYRPTIVATKADFERELAKGGWDLVVAGFSDAEIVRQRTRDKMRILPIVLKVSAAEMGATKARYRVVLFKVPSNDGFVRAVGDALAARKTTQSGRTG